MAVADFKLRAEEIEDVREGSSAHRGNVLFQALGSLRVEFAHAQVETADSRIREERLYEVRTLSPWGLANIRGHIVLVLS